MKLIILIAALLATAACSWLAPFTSDTGEVREDVCHSLSVGPFEAPGCE